jgi:hypothetical protein
MLVVARQQLAQERDRKARAQQVRRDREVKAAMRRNERDAARAAMWHERLMPAMDPGLTAQERCRRIARVLSSKGNKIQVKDLTPELRDIADAYLANFGDRDIFAPAEGWLMEASRWARLIKNPEAASPGERLRLDLRGHPNIEYLRVAALNHLRRRFDLNVDLVDGTSRAHSEPAALLENTKHETQAAPHRPTRTSSASRQLSEVIGHRSRVKPRLTR